MLNDLSKNRSIALDCIRGIAILMVLFFHVAVRYNSDGLDAIAYFFRRIGYFGVDVFFPLSGYLISRFLLQHADTGSIRTFFLRRVFRILPLYLIAVTCYFAASELLQRESGTIDRIWINYLFLTGWLIFIDGVESVPFTITWSLSVEEFAYILFGIVAWKMRRQFIAFLCGAAIVAIGLRAFLLLNDSSLLNIYYFPPARLDSVALGGIAAFAVLSEEKKGRTTAIFGAVALAAIAACLIGNDVVYGMCVFVAVTCVTCTLITAFETLVPPVDGPLAKALAKIGFYSYFIYLFHYFNIDFLIAAANLISPQFTLPYWGLTLFALGLTYAQALVSFRFFERPIMQYGRSLEYAPCPKQPLKQP